MTVYVDDASIQATVPNGRISHTSKWSHLTADTKDELHAFAAKLGLRRSYFQDKPNGLWHYDVTEGKRRQAIRLGAVEISYGTEAFETVWHSPGREGVRVRAATPTSSSSPSAGATTKVIHLRDSAHGKSGGGSEVYIGRPSPWGNPFAIGRDGERERVIDLYREYLYSAPELMAQVRMLRGKTLVCFCAPSPCHGDVLAALADDDMPATSVVIADAHTAAQKPNDDAGGGPRTPVGWVDGFSPRSRFYALSNFGPGTCVIDGVEYPSGEHGFNAAKTLDPALRARIRAAATPREAKRLGSKGGIITELRPEWDGVVRYEAMRQVVATKFAAGSSLADLLLNTGDELLVETNTWHDNHWGNCVCDTHRPWPGRNELARALMRHRAVLRDDRPDRWVRVMCTGHRDKYLSTEQRQWMHTELARVAAKLIREHGMRVAIHGGANGADLAWARAADEAGVDSLWAYLPFRDQTKGWNEAQRSAWTRYTTSRDHGGAATKKWTLGEAFDVRLLHARNEAMIRDAQAVVAVCDPSKATGGTASALNKIGDRLPIIRLDIVALRTTLLNFEPHREPEIEDATA